jgi:tRNA(Ile)-lysidine synthase
MKPLTLAGLQRTLSPWLPAPRVWVAFSGGLDSTVLLHLLAAWHEPETEPKAIPQFEPEASTAYAAFHSCDLAASPAAGNPSQTTASPARSPLWRSLPLAAIHVDHGLHPDSTAWAAHCRQVCAALGVPLTLLRLALHRRPGESLEALAREGRYGILRELAGPGDLVLTAQHRDDQAETLLLALLRGSGVKGLAAMPMVAPLGEAWLLRPLLDYSRAQLLAWAQARGLCWLEDPSNPDLTFDRNFLRARVLPVLAERWPACATSLARTAAHCAEAQGLIEGLAVAELARLGGSRPGTLSLRRLAALEPALLAAVLRHWIAGLGLQPPDSRHLGRIRDELLTARPDRQPLVAWPGAEARRYRDDLYVMAPLPAVPTMPLPAVPATPAPVTIPEGDDDRLASLEPIATALTLKWRRGDLLLPAGLGRLRLIGQEGGVGQDPETRWPGGLEVRFTGEGLSCRPLGQGHHRRLKHLFQEAGIPPWLRPYVPRLFAGDRLIAVGDRWRCTADTAAPGEDWLLLWQGGIRDHPGFG